MSPGAITPILVGGEYGFLRDLIVVAPSLLGKFQRSCGTREFKPHSSVSTLNYRF
jgi:hypothetical protein